LIECTIVMIEKLVAHRERRRMRNFNPDVIVVLSGGIAPGVNSYHSTEFTETDTRGKIGWGRERVVAGNEIFQINPSAKILTVCWSVDRPGVRRGSVSDAQVMAEELESLGIPNQQVYRENGNRPHAYDTFTELVSTLNLCLENNWSNTIIVSTAFQRKRAKLMLQSLLRQNMNDQRQIDTVFQNYYDRFPNLSSDIQYFQATYTSLQNHLPELQQLHIRVVAAESFLPLTFQRIKEEVRQILRSPRYRQEVRNGNKGARDWRRGRYGKRENVITE